MFEKQIALEKAQGYRGPATRFAGAVPPGPEALVVLREMCFGILTLAALQVLFGLKGYPLVVGLGLAFALPASLLLFTKSRFVAFAQLVWFLVLFVGVMTLAPPRGLLATAVWVALFFLAGRASLASVRLSQVPASHPVPTTPAVLASNPGPTSQSGGV